MLCVGISVAELEVISSSSTNAVAVIVPSDNDPNCIVPLDVMFHPQRAVVRGSLVSPVTVALAPSLFLMIVLFVASL